LTRARLTVLIVVPLALSMFAIAPAGAGTPGHWEKLGADVGSPLYLPGLVRATNGSLHVVWEKTVGSNKQQYVHVTLSKNGASGPATNVLGTTWSTLHEDPKLVRNGSGIRLLFSGLDGSVSSGFFYQATSANGSSWSSPAKSAQWGTAYGAYGVGADTFADGTPIVGGVLNSDGYWHVGTNAADADGHFNVSGASMLDANLAVDRGTDAAWMAWYDQGKGGVWARQVSPTLGGTAKAPSSTAGGGNSLAPGQQLPLATRPGGGVYTVYCSTYPYCKTAKLWKLGTAKTVTINVTDNTDRMTLGVGSGGRIWLLTHDSGTGLLYVTRSNKAVTKFGPVKKIKPPAKTSGVYRMAIDGSVGRGDIVADVGTTTGVDNIWHTQVIPGLTMTASAKKWSGNSAKKVTFSVKDAGDAVSGSKVRAGTRSCTTGGNGTCAITFPKLPPQKITATATAAGYAKAKVKLTIT
jgi:hypothetical protein